MRVSAPAAAKHFGSIRGAHDDECQHAGTGDLLLRQHVLGPPLDWDEDRERELRLQDDLCNKLVEIRAHRQALIALTVDDPVVQTTEAAIKGALDALMKEKSGQGDVAPIASRLR